MFRENENFYSVRRFFSKVFFNGFTKTRRKRAKKKLISHFNKKLCAANKSVSFSTLFTKSTIFSIFLHILFFSTFLSDEENYRAMV
jgi:hypothetical protein